MHRRILLCCLIGTLVNCSTIQENPQDTWRKSPREESLDRAKGLAEIGEKKAALKSAERLFSKEPPDEISIEALLLYVNIQQKQDNPKDALKKIDEFSARFKNANLDQSSLDKAKARVLRQIEKSSIIEAEIKRPATPEKVTPERKIAQAIGVMVPLSGTYKVYGERVLASLKLAMADVGIHVQNDSLTFPLSDGTTVYVVDSMGLPEASQRTVDRLVIDHQVGIIVGDILTETAAAIAERAAKHDVINLSLSRKDGLTKLGETIFQMAITPKKQIEALVSLRTEPGERFAIFYPENTFGLEMREAFRTVARKKELNIVKVVGYSPSETTYTSSIRKLVGPKITAGNTNFEKCQGKANHIADVNARRKAERSCLENVAPNISFDALFVPDFPKNLGYIIPALISEGVMVSQNENMVDAYRKTMGNPYAKPVYLFGPSSFNNLSLGEKLGSQIDGVSFVDCGNYEGETENLIHFKEEFEKLMGTPPLLLDVIAYDAIRNVLAILKSADKRDGIDLNEISRLLHSNTHEGLVGATYFDDERESNIPLRLFSFSNGSITAVN